MMVDKLVEKYELTKSDAIDGIYTVSDHGDRPIMVRYTSDGVIYPAISRSYAYRIQADLDSIKVIYKGQLIYRTNGRGEELVDTIHKFHNNTIYIKPYKHFCIMQRAGYSLYLDDDEIYIRTADGGNSAFGLFDIGIKVLKDSNPLIISFNLSLKEVADFIYKNKRRISFVNHMDFFVIDVCGYIFYFPEPK